MPVYTLGTLEASEALLRDLYIDLRAKVNAWSQIPCQTPQARMGYVGQHLVSVVTGFPGGKSGARGHDLEMGEGAYGEIKTLLPGGSAGGLPGLRRGGLQPGDPVRPLRLPEHRPEGRLQVAYHPAQRRGVCPGAGASAVLLRPV